MPRPKGRGKTVYLTLDALKSLGLTEDASSDEINNKIQAISAKVASDFNSLVLELLESHKEIKAELKPFIPNSALDARIKEIITDWVVPYARVFATSFSSYLKKSFWLYAKENKFLTNRTLLKEVTQEQIDKLKAELEGEFGSWE